VYSFLLERPARAALALALCVDRPGRKCGLLSGKIDSGVMDQLAKWAGHGGNSYLMKGNLTPCLCHLAAQDTDMFDCSLSVHNI